MHVYSHSNVFLSKVKLLKNMSVSVMSKLNGIVVFVIVIFSVLAEDSPHNVKYILSGHYQE